MFLLRRLCIAFATIIYVTVVSSSPVQAINPANWQVEISTSGEDVFWTSPTSLTTGLPEYDWSFEITKLTANVAIFGDQDVLGLLEDTSGSGTQIGLPVVLLDEVINEEVTGSTANIRIDVDAAGVGHASGTNIELGRLLGLPIRRIDLEAAVSILGIPSGDYDRDGDVDEADYVVWRSTAGSTTELNADGNGNEVVDAADYVTWRKNQGTDTKSTAASATTVPEPGFLQIVSVLALSISGSASRWRRDRWRDRRR
jgi:hypothetical protein